MASIKWLCLILLMHDQYLGYLTLPSYAIHENIVDDKDRPEGSCNVNMAPLSGEDNDSLQNHHNQHDRLCMVN